MASCEWHSPQVAAACRASALRSNRTSSSWSAIFSCDRAGCRAPWVHAHTTRSRSREAAAGQFHRTETGAFPDSLWTAATMDFCDWPWPREYGAPASQSAQSARIRSTWSGPLRILRGEGEIRIITRNRRAVVRLRSLSRPHLCRGRLILRLAPGSATRNLHSLHRCFQS